MKKLVWCSSVLIFSLQFVSSAWALKLELLAVAELPHKMKFEKTVVGGLSAIYFDGDSSTLTAVSDDRGREGAPRFYEFDFNYSDHKLSVVPKAVHLIKTKGPKLTLDMEGLAPLPWGNFLISSEGDLGKKPRAMPEILDVKKDGTLVRSFELPAKFLPEAQGPQTKGIRNNRGLEGLTRAPLGSAGGDHWYLMNEESLVQDSKAEAGPLRLLVYDSPEAWVIKPGKEYVYLPEGGSAEPSTRLTLAGRVSELLALSNEQFLVLERSMQVEPNRFSYVCKIFVAKLADAVDVSGVESLAGKDLKSYKPMKKELVLDLETLKEKLGETDSTQASDQASDPATVNATTKGHSKESIKNSIENFEGLAFGPEVNKKKTLIVVSDDNFKKSERTQILLFSIND